MCEAAQSKRVSRFHKSHFYAEIYRKNATPQSEHLDQAGLYSYRKNPSVWSHCLGMTFIATPSGNQAGASRLTMAQVRGKEIWKRRKGVGTGGKSSPKMLAQYDELEILRAFWTYQNCQNKFQQMCVICIDMTGVYVEKQYCFEGRLKTEFMGCLILADKISPP